MTYETEIAKLDDALKEANRVKLEIVHRKTAERDSAIAEIDARLNAKFKAELDAAYKAASAAARAAWDYRNEHATHPLEGRKVVRRWNKPVNKWTSKTEPAEEFGVVEVRREDTQFPDNLGRWWMPDLGTAFIRLVKADGTLGLKLAKSGILHDGRLGAGWELADD